MNLYSRDPSIYPDVLLELIEPHFSEEINQNLCEEFSDKEIADALFQIGPLKAPGPDGMPDRFFQHNWPLLKDEVTKAVKDFFTNGNIPEGANDTDEG